jgi:hypothetical protein
MKKALLFSLLLMGAGFAKAQNQSLKLKQPFSTKDLGIVIDTIAPNLTEKRPGLYQPQKDELAQSIAIKPAGNEPVYDEVFYSTMPVAGTGSSNSNMAVIKSDNLNTRYTMPVKRIAIVDPTKTKPAKVTP